MILQVFEPRNVQSFQNITTKFRSYVCTWDLLEIAFLQNGKNIYPWAPTSLTGDSNGLHHWLAWRGRGGGGSSAKRGGGAQHDGGSAVAAAQRLRRWRQRDSATSAAELRRRGGGGSVKRGGGAQHDGGSAVAAGWRLRWWRQRNRATWRQRNVGGGATLAVAWRRHGGGGSGSVSGSGGSAKRCGGAQC